MATTKKATAKKTTTRKAATKKTTAKKTAAKKTTPKKAAKGKEFFIYDLATKKVVKAEKAKLVEFKGFEDFNFFIHTSLKGWAVSEAVTGAKVADGKTQVVARNNARRTLDNVGIKGLMEALSKSLKAHGQVNKDYPIPTPNKQAAPKTAAPKKTVTEKPAVKPQPKKAVKKESNRRGKPKGKMSMLDAAVEILKKSKEPLTVKDITQAIFKAGLCTSEGRTPHATLSAAIGREINNRGKESRFIRADRGLFALA